MARHRRVSPKDPKAAEAYYAAEALAAGLSPRDLATVATGTADELRASMGLGPLPNGQGKGNVLVSAAEQERARIANGYPKQPYLSPATGGEDNPFSATMKLSPEAAQHLRELAGVLPVDDRQLSPAQLEEALGLKPKGKSIINTTTRGDEDKQRIATPWAFIHALEQRFGVPVDFDLAADDNNTKAPFLRWFSEKQDALRCNWGLGLGRGLGGNGSSKLAFLNPPFAHIKPWALGPKDNPAAGMLACRWLPRWTVMLVPASYSTDWFLELKGKVQRDAIPRIQFEGATHLYPKDLTLIVAGFGVVGDGYWDWRVSYLQWCVAHHEQSDPIHAKGCSALVKEGRLADYLPDYACTRSPFAKPA